MAQRCLEAMLPPEEMSSAIHSREERENFFHQADRLSLDELEDDGKGGRYYLLNDVIDEAIAALQAVVNYGEKGRDIDEAIRAARWAHHYVAAAMEQEIAARERALDRPQPPAREKLLSKGSLDSLKSAARYAATAAGRLDGMCECLGIPGPELPRPSHISGGYRDACKKCLAALGHESTAKTQELPSEIAPLAEEAKKALPLLYRLFRIRAEQKAAVRIIEAFLDESQPLPDEADEKKLAEIRDSYSRIGARIANGEPALPEGDALLLQSYTATVAAQINAVLQCIEKERRYVPVVACLAMLGDEEAIDELKASSDAPLSLFASTVDAWAGNFRRVLKKERLETMTLYPHRETPLRYHFSARSSGLHDVLKRLHRGATAVSEQENERLEQAAVAYQTAADTLRQMTHGKPTPEEENAIAFGAEMADEINRILRHVEQNKTALIQGRKPVRTEAWHEPGR